MTTASFCRLRAGSKARLQFFLDEGAAFGTGDGLLPQQRIEYAVQGQRRQAKAKSAQGE
jgi:hypothetical protein